MTHVVAGYPTMQECLELIVAMQKSGAVAIEVQIPFSDPNADGPVIMQANDVALEANTTIQDTFELIKAARSRGVTVPLYIMSYLNKLVHFGLPEFYNLTVDSGVDGIIVPDLPFDCLEYQQLHKLTTTAKTKIIPVLTPNMSEDRLHGYDLTSAPIIYITSANGITGKTLQVSPDLIAFTKKVKSLTNAKIAIGFGVRTPQHVRQVLRICDIAIVGSVVVEAIKNGGTKAAIKQLDTLIHGIKH
jgi:tryptophan synthase alpha subunit